MLTAEEWQRPACLMAADRRRPRLCGLAHASRSLNRAQWQAGLPRRPAGSTINPSIFRMWSGQTAQGERRYAGQYRLLLIQQIPPFGLLHAFNVAVPFIDRHPAEGRGAEDCHSHGPRRCELWAVGRAGQPLRQCAPLNGPRGRRAAADDRQRLPRILLFSFGGRSRPGLCRCRSTRLLRATDYQYMIDDLRVYAGRLFRRVRADRRNPALAGAERTPQSVCVAGGGLAFRSP